MTNPTEPTTAEVAGAVAYALDKARARDDRDDAQAQAGTLAVLRAAMAGKTPDEMRAASRAARAAEDAR
jgi:hypothetical protein